MVMVVISSSFLARPMSRELLGQKNKGIKHIRERSRLYQISLYSASVLLAFTVFEVHALYNWAPVLVASEHVGAIEKLTKTITIGAGVCFSLFLVIVYLPTAMINSQLLNRIVMEGIESDKAVDPSKWRAKHGIPSSLLSSFSGLIAIAMPFVTGVLGIL